MTTPLDQKVAKEELDVLHNCPAIGKNTLTPRAFNTAYPGKIFYKCPFCGYMYDPRKNNISQAEREVLEDR